MPSFDSTDGNRRYTVRVSPHPARAGQLEVNRTYPEDLDGGWARGMTLVYFDRNEAMILSELLAQVAIDLPIVDPSEIVYYTSADHPSTEESDENGRSESPQGKPSD